MPLNVDEFEKDLDDMINGFHHSVVKFVSTLGFFCLSIMERIQLEYEDAGSPYGEDQDGMYKWAKEKIKTVAAINRDALKDRMLKELDDWLGADDLPEDEDEDDDDSD